MGKSAVYTINDLKIAISNAWRSIPNELLENLIGSMHKRMYEVVKRRGDSIKY